MYEIRELSGPVNKNAMELTQDKYVSYFNNVKFYSKSSLGAKFRWKDIVLFVRQGYLYLFKINSGKNPAFKRICLMGYNNVLRPIPPKKGTCNWQFIILPLESLSEKLKAYYFCPTRSDDRRTWMMHILNSMAIANDSKIDKVIMNECTKETCELGYDVLETCIYVKNAKLEEELDGVYGSPPKFSKMSNESIYESVYDVDFDDDRYMDMFKKNEALKTNDTQCNTTDESVESPSIQESNDEKTIIKPGKNAFLQDDSSFENFKDEISCDAEEYIVDNEVNCDAEESIVDNEVNCGAEKSLEIKPIPKPRKNLQSKQNWLLMDKLNSRVDKSPERKPTIKTRSQNTQDTISVNDGTESVVEDKLWEHYYSASYFDESSYKAKLILTNKSPGTYLIRVQNCGHQQLYVKFEKIHKFEITYNFEMEQYSIWSNEVFPTVAHLLYYYHYNDICRDGKLTFPFQLA